jgi:hypothetical protein
VEVLAVAQAARVDPEGVVAVLAEAARERVLRVAVPAAEVASEVAQLEALPDPAATPANG